MSTTARSLDEIRADAQAAMSDGRHADLPALFQELGRRECEILGEKLGRQLEPGTPQAEAELWLEGRETWAANDHRWLWLRDFVAVANDVVKIAAENREDQDSLWFAHAVGAVGRLIPALPEAFDIRANHERTEGYETALAEIERITDALHERNEGEEER